MKKADILKNLCSYDERNPGNVLDLMFDVGVPKGKCVCDNCFYGRTELALKIVELIDQSYEVEDRMPLC